MAWVKGQSGNLSGRPKGLGHYLNKESRDLRSECLNLVVLLLHQELSKKNNQIDPQRETTKLERIVKKLVSLAETGDMDALKIILLYAAAQLPKNPDEDEFSDEDLRVLKRVKEIRQEEESKDIVVSE